MIHPALPPTAAAVRSAVAAIVVCLLALTGPSHAEPVVDEALRAGLLKRPDGQIAHLKTKYNEIVVTKRRHQLTLAFRVRDWEYIQSIVDLRDPDVLPLRLSRAMTTSVVYPPQTRRVLMLGIGGGSISTYLARAMPDVEIDAVDIDPGVIEVAQSHFGIRQGKRIRFIASDARAHLQNNSQTYDIILHDAYHGGGVPSQLMTREFYELIRARLTPGGVAAYNIHDGTKHYLPTLKTLQATFSSVHLYPSGAGEVIAVASPIEPPDAKTLANRAAELQERHGFRYPLPQLLARRAAMPRTEKANVISDETIARERSQTGKPGTAKRAAE